MRMLPLLLLLAAPARAISFDEARHLLSRTGFSAAPEEIAALEPLAYEEAVDRLLAGARREAMTAPPSWADDPPPDPRLARRGGEEERRAFRMERREEGLELKRWWYAEMIHTDSPLTERMTLFWHNHFTSSLQKVKWAPLMYRQNVLLRRHALGSFRELLHEASKDPAMILYLDNQSNRKGKPNENFAREVLELFTLGEGRYTERDIKEAARAFTGWMVDRGTGRFVFRRRRHDDGVKAVLGRSGRFDGDQVLDVILEQPRVAVFIAEKLWREFVSEEPDPAEIERLAGEFRRSGYRIRPLVRGLLLTRQFRDPSNRGVLIKSPVELMVGTVRLLKLPLRDPAPLVMAGRRPGQDILDPPNVKGWPGGARWITTHTLLARQEVLSRALRGEEMGGKGMRRRRAAMGGEEEGAWLDLAPEEAERLLLPLPPAQRPPEDARGPRLVRALVLDPVYQLK